MFTFSCDVKLGGVNDCAKEAEQQVSGEDGQIDFHFPVVDDGGEKNTHKLVQTEEGEGDIGEEAGDCDEDAGGSDREAGPGHSQPLLTVDCTNKTVVTTD